MKESLFEDESYTARALMIEAEITEAIKQIFDIYSEDHPVRELEYIVNALVSDIARDKIIKSSCREG